MKINSNKFKDIIVVYSFLIPIISRWILPSSLESLLYINIVDYFQFYILNILFLPFLFLGIRNYTMGRLKLLFVFQLIIILCSVFLNEYRDVLLSLVCGSYYPFAIFILLNYKFNKSQISLIRFPILFSLLFLTIQIILFSTGILKYHLDITGGEFANIFRISTTVGAATGTSIVVLLLGVISLFLAKSRKCELISLILTSISLLLLISRSAILCFIIFLFFYYKKFFSLNIKNLFITTILIILFYHIGLFNPLYERTIKGFENSDITSGRDVLVEDNMKKLDGSKIFGLGYANVYTIKRIIGLHKKPLYYGAPHNVYVLILLEQGIIGLTFFVLFWLLFLKKIFKVNKFGGIFTVLFMMTIFNTETVILVDQEYIFLWVLFLIIIKEEKDEKNIIHSFM